MAKFQRGPPNWGKNRDFRTISGLPVYDCYRASSVEYGYHTQRRRLCITQMDDEVPASVNLVYEASLDIVFTTRWV